MRLKEFWQLEFQCAYTADSGNDYHAASLEPVRRMIAALIPLPTRIVPSDRLPTYSETTVDVEVDNGDKWIGSLLDLAPHGFSRALQDTAEKGAGGGARRPRARDRHRPRSLRL